MLIWACVCMPVHCRFMCQAFAAFGSGGIHSCSIVVGCLPGSQADRERVFAQLPTGFEIVQKVWDGVPWP